MFFFVCHIWLLVFSQLLSEPESGAGIDAGMALTTFPSCIFDETRFKLTTFSLQVKFANH